MKNFPGLSRVAILSSFLALSLFFFACKKSGVGNNNKVPVAYLMAFNLAPEKPGVGVAVSGNSLTQSPLTYTAYTGSYLSIYPGTRQVESFDFTTSTAIASTTFDFDTSKYYSAFVVGPLGTYSNVVVEDKLDNLSASSGMAYIRYINAVPGQSFPTITITSNGTSVVNNIAQFAMVSEFIPVQPGNLSISVANMEGDIETDRVIQVAKQKVYTILLVGQPGSTDTNKKVQLKFVENGTLQ